MFQINNILSSDSNADPHDVLTIKNALRHRGYYKKPDYGLTPYADKGLFDGIKKYQKNKGLKVDGVMKPGGETLQTLESDENIPFDEPRHLIMRDTDKPPPLRTMEKKDTDPTPPLRKLPMIPDENRRGIEVWHNRILEKEDDNPEFDYFPDESDEDGDFIAVDPGEANEAEGDSNGEDNTSEEIEHDPEEESDSDSEDSETEPAPEEKPAPGKPVFDATGRMIRLEGVQPDEQQRYLDIIEKVNREHVETGRKYGLKEAADNLEHFLDGSGKTKTLGREQAREKLFVRNGERVNRDRFTQSFTDKQKVGSKLLKLEEGQKVNIRDNWDYKVGYFPDKSITDPSRSHILRGDIDEILSTGNSSVKSEGDFQAKRQGNTILIDGVVSHKWGDRYDFDLVQSGGASATTLEKAGRAKSFDIESKWDQRVTGTVQIKDGKLVNPRLTWKDINPKKE